jgi:hypothetical protein
MSEEGYLLARFAFAFPIVTRPSTSLVLRSGRTVWASRTKPVRAELVEA